MTDKLIVIPRAHVADIELPRPVERLYDLAYNLWWSWNPLATQLFAVIDRATWAMYRNPVQELINVEPAHWEGLCNNDEFMTHYGSVIAAFDRYMDGLGESWFHRHHPDYASGPVAYFSMEYGLHQCLALYSGGLGVLSGDHCKSASDLGLPFVAVGLLYRQGYFRQTIDAEGRQQQIFPEFDLSRLPVRPAVGHTGREILVAVPFPGREVHAKVWVAQVGRVPLILLDTDIPRNHPADRPITGMLYVQGREMRLCQELVLGIGGARALAALGIEPAVWHINEGHSSLLQLDRLRHKVEQGASPEAALAAIRRDTVFTTHTPVPAGNEQFDRALARGYLAPWSGASTGLADPLQLGQADAGHDSFNLTALAMRTSGFVNGVSRLNAEVLNRMWHDLLASPDSPVHRIMPITNGVHNATWVGLEIRALLDRWVTEDWQRVLLEPELWERVLEIPDADLWRAHLAQKARLGRFTRSRLREQFARHGRSPGELRKVDELFDPEVLTIGFARRFATYKRANLLFRHADRLRALFGKGDQPLQIIFAGKAHPADRPGQDLIQTIFQLSQSDALRGRVYFLENYDMRVGRMLVQGVDVWLNTPRRPLEASGTSGMKAAINGALNVSVLDGWWPEGFDGENGWVIGNGDSYGSEAEQDDADAHALYDLLENRVVPAFYGRDAKALPRDWIARMKRAIATVSPRFSSDRMVREYLEQTYLEAARRSQEIEVG